MLNFQITVLLTGFDIEPKKVVTINKHDLPIIDSIRSPVLATTLKGLICVLLFFCFLSFSSLTGDQAPRY